MFCSEAKALNIICVTSEGVLEQQAKKLETNGKQRPFISDHSATMMTMAGRSGATNEWLHVAKRYSFKAAYTLYR